MYGVYAYGKEHAPIPDYTSSGNVITMPINPFKGEIISLGQTINFIDNWLQWFEDNYDNRILIYKESTSKSFKKIPISLPPKNLVITKKKTRQLSMQYVVNGIYTRLMPIYPYQEKAIDKKIKTKEEKTREKLL